MSVKIKRLACFSRKNGGRGFFSHGRRRSLSTWERACTCLGKLFEGLQIRGKGRGSRTLLIIREKNCLLKKVPPAAIPTLQKERSKHTCPGGKGVGVKYALFRKTVIVGPHF